MDKEEFLKLSLEEKSMIYLNDFFYERFNPLYHNSYLILDMHNYLLEENFLEIIGETKKSPGKYDITPKAVKFIE